MWAEISAYIPNQLQPNGGTRALLPAHQHGVKCVMKVMVMSVIKVFTAWEKTCGCKFALTSRTIIQPSGPLFVLALIKKARRKRINPLPSANCDHLQFNLAGCRYIKRQSPALYFNIFPDMVLIGYTKLMTPCTASAGESLRCWGSLGSGSWLPMLASISLVRL